jgi:hypothetical protein
MKKQVLRIFSLLSLSVMLAVVSVSANPTSPLEANIPFDFSVGGKTLLAGVYTVTPMTTPGILLIRSEDGRAAALVVTNRVQARQEQDQTKLVFHRYGNQYFLAQVWRAGDGDGRELLRSRAERELIKSNSNHLAKKAAEPEVVRIVAK